MDDLSTGVLAPLRDRVLADRSLCLEIREDYINIYYRGGSLLKLSIGPGGYVAFFDLKYAKGAGETIERAVKESGIEDLEKKLERNFKGKKGKPKIKIDLSTSSAKDTPSDKDRIKKRVRGLIKLQNSLPIDKLAQALNRASEDAENLIYELVDEGINGTMEADVFKFTSAPEDVISKINELIDKM